jgi:hypothetical protein
MPTVDMLYFAFIPSSVGKPELKMTALEEIAEAFHDLTEFNNCV